jgi:hypothetical protein
MPAEDARPTDAEQVAPLAIQCVQHQGPEPDARGLWDPDALIVGNRLRDYLMRRQ